MAAEQDEQGERTEGPTPNGGAYAILYRHADGSGEVVEFDESGKAIFRTYFDPPPRRGPDDEQAD